MSAIFGGDPPFTPQQVDEMTDDELRDAIRHASEQHEIRQSTIARQARVNQAQISLWLRGKLATRNPTRSTQLVLKRLREWFRSKMEIGQRTVQKRQVRQTKKQQQQEEKDTLDLVQEPEPPLLQEFTGPVEGMAGEDFSRDWWHFRPPIPDSMLNAVDPLAASWEKKFKSTIPGSGKRLAIDSVAALSAQKRRRVEKIQAETKYICVVEERPTVSRVMGRFVPIRITVEMPTGVVEEFVVWDRRDNDLSPEMFASQTVEDLGLPLSAKEYIASQVRLQMKWYPGAYHPVSLPQDALKLLKARGRKDVPPPSVKGNLSPSLSSASTSTATSTSTSASVASTAVASRAASTTTAEASVSTTAIASSVAASSASSASSTTSAVSAIPASTTFASAAATATTTSTSAGAAPPPAVAASSPAAAASSPASTAPVSLAVPTSSSESVEARATAPTSLPPADVSSTSTTAAAVTPISVATSTTQQTPPFSASASTSAPAPAPSSSTASSPSTSTAVSVSVATESSSASATAQGMEPVEPSPSALAAEATKQKSLDSLSERQKRWSSLFEVADPAPATHEMERLHKFSLHVRYGNLLYVDAFEWDINCPCNSVEDFVYQTCCDLGLPAELQPMILVEVLQQLQQYQVSALVHCGIDAQPPRGPGGITPGTEDYFGQNLVHRVKVRLCPPVEAHTALRPPGLLDAYSPKVTLATAEQVQKSFDEEFTNLHIAALRAKKGTRPQQRPAGAGAGGAAAPGGSPPSRPAAPTYLARALFPSFGGGAVRSTPFPPRYRETGARLIGEGMLHPYSYPELRLARLEKEIDMVRNKVANTPVQILLEEDAFVRGDLSGGARLVSAKEENARGGVPKGTVPSLGIGKRWGEAIAATLRAAEADVVGEKSTDNPAVDLLDEDQIMGIHHAERPEDLERSKGKGRRRRFWRGVEKMYRFLRDANEVSQTEKGKDVFGAAMGVGWLDGGV